MHVLNLIFVLTILVFSIFLYKLVKQPLINVCEMEKCPYCYGTDLCVDFKQNSFTLSSISIFDLIMNYVSVKNVLYAHYGNKSVVLKKLGHNFELDELDRQICRDTSASDNCDLLNINDTQNYLTKITDFLTVSSNDKIKHFKICSITGTRKFVQLLNRFNTPTVNDSRETFLKHIWTALQLNAEPLLIQLLKVEDHWPVPQYVGACGRVIVESHCGSSLNSFAEAEWNTRAYLALQLLEAAVNFTEKHPDFRFYLTDVSPDNIAVSSNLKVSFVDLEDVIVAHKGDVGSRIHRSTGFNAEDGFAFSEQEICGSSISDHNYYAICKLLLSENAPWPMMRQGLLHSPPSTISKTYPHLFQGIEVCAHQLQQMDCFQAVAEIIKILKKVLS